MSFQNIIHSDSDSLPLPASPISSPNNSNSPASSSPALPLLPNHSLSPHYHPHHLSSPSISPPPSLPKNLPIIDPPPSSFKLPLSNLVWPSALSFKPKSNSFSISSSKSKSKSKSISSSTLPSSYLSPATSPPLSPSRKLRPRPAPSPLLARLDSPSAWLAYYFAFNLGLTIYNKRLLNRFPFPWTLTAVHTLAGTFGSQLARSQGFFTAARLSRRHSLLLLAFSVLYTVNIAVSNVSLQLVTVPFHQVVRATTPLFTIVLSVACLHKRYPPRTYGALLIVVAGVGLSTYGDYGWTGAGLALTLLGTVLAAVKTVVTNAIQVGRLRLNALDLLMRMSPLAFVQCVLYAYWTGEVGRVRAYAATEMDGPKALALATNGLIAFGLNVVSFTANKKTSALTMTVAANVKQVLTILLAIIIFRLVITPTNLIGISITLIGGAYYAKIELDRQAAAKLRDAIHDPDGLFKQGIISHVSALDKKPLGLGFSIGMPAGNDELGGGTRKEKSGLRPPPDDFSSAAMVMVGSTEIGDGGPFVQLRSPPRS